MTVTAVTALNTCMTSHVLEKLCLVSAARVASAASRCFVSCLSLGRVWGCPAPAPPTAVQSATGSHTSAAFSTLEKAVLLVATLWQRPVVVARRLVSARVGGILTLGRHM